MDQHAIDTMGHDTPEPRPVLQELNEQWTARVRQQQSEQARRDDSARHAAIINTAACLVRIKYLLGLLLLCTVLILLCTVLILLCTVLILWKRW